ncbi:MurR/RpiR family transcriptional regulator [Luethyella okanaganae]|uniref:MurR/RpiR family transcriptional regulator n=1 Tax=Luethyella okanaganae TaxID=69372 RepID=A0ABW1VGR4_9MICO
MANSALADDALVRTRAALATFHPAERRVADYVLADPTLVVGLSISELAQRCGTSEATVSRLVRTLGFDGYKQFRLAVTRASTWAEAVEGGIALSSDIEPNEPIAAIVEKIAYSDRVAIDETARTIDMDQLERATSALASAGRISIFGVGASELVASDLAQKLQRVNLQAWSYLDPDRAAGASSLLREGDVAITFSSSGETASSVAVQREAARSGATTIAAISNPRSTLATEADIVLASATRETTYRSGATSSRIAQLFVVDCLFVATASRTHRVSAAALAHTRRAVQQLRAASEH